MVVNSIDYPDCKIIWPERSFGTVDFSVGYNFSLEVLDYLLCVSAFNVSIPRTPIVDSGATVL